MAGVLALECLHCPYFFGSLTGVAGMNSRAALQMVQGKIQREKKMFDQAVEVGLLV